MFKKSCPFSFSEYKIKIRYLLWPYKNVKKYIIKIKTFFIEDTQVKPISNNLKIQIL